MDNALIDELYKHAYYIAKTFRIPGHDLEDLKQECVIKACEVIKKTKVWTWQYIRVSMYYHLIDLLRAQNARPQLAEMLEVYEGSYRMAFLELPTIPRKDAQLLLIELLQDFSLKHAYKNLGWNYWKGASIWRETKHYLRRNEVSYVEV